MNGPLFILGAPRSGASLLYRVLALHPRAAWISNYNRRLTGLPEVAVLNRLGQRAPQLRRRAWFGENTGGAWPDTRRRPALERLVPRPVEGEPLFERRRVVPGLADPTPDSRQLRLRADLECLARAAGGRTLVSKRIGHNRRIPLLAEIFPDCRFVVVARDGRAVSRSLLAEPWWPEADIWWFGGTPTDWERQGGDPLVLAAMHWVREVEAIEEGMTQVPARRFLRVTYEALVRSPMDVLAGTAVWSGLGDDPIWREELAHVRFPDRHRVSGRAPVDARVGQIQAGMLRALGYPA